MKWSFRIGTIAGIRVQLHVTFLLFVVWIAATRGLFTGHAGQAIAAVVLLLLVFTCVLLHELGHALTARRYGIPTRDITLLPIGGIARLERMPDKPTQEVVVALAGPAVNVVIATVLAVATRGFGGSLVQELERGGIVETLFVINVMMVLFNMIPAFPMDGGRVFRALLAMSMPYERATRIASSVGQVVALVFGVVGLFGIPGVFPPNTLLMFIALFVFLAAGEERNLVQTRASIQGLPVRAAMLTEFHQLAVDDTLRRAVDHLMAGSQTDFPVLEHGVPVGVLSREQLVEAISRRGLDAPVGTVIRRDHAHVEAAAPLDTVLHSLRQAGRAALPVTDNGAMVGLLTLDNVGDLLLVRQALRRQMGDGTA